MLNVFLDFFLLLCENAVNLFTWTHVTNVVAADGCGCPSGTWTVAAAAESVTVASVAAEKRRHDDGAIGIEDDDDDADGGSGVGAADGCDATVN